MSTFGLNTLPCEGAANFLLEHSDEIVRYAESKYGFWPHIPRRMKFQAGIEWLADYADTDDEDGDAYPLADWIEWAKNHRA